MVTLEEYELAYNLYREGKILEANTTSLELKSLTESTEVIQEGVADTIRKYVNKIIKGIQSAWDKFKGNVTKSRLKYTDEQVKAALEKEPHITVNDYIDYKPDTMNNIKIGELNYNTMANDLKDVPTFMKKYYSSIYSDQNKSIYDNIRAKCLGQRSDKYKITKEDLSRMYDYTSKYDEFKTKLEEEIKVINKAADASDYIARTSATTAESVSTLDDTMKYYFTEADDEPKPTIVKDEEEENKEGNTTEGGEEKKEDKNDNSEVVTKVQNYFKAVSEILSSEMRISREIFLFYGSIINQHMNNVEKAKKKAKKTEGKKEENNTEDNTKTNNVNL
jgi:hypothetical protein